MLSGRIPPECCISTTDVIDFFMCIAFFMFPYWRFVYVCFSAPWNKWPKVQVKNSLSFFLHSFWVKVFKRFRIKLSTVKVSCQWQLMVKWFYLSWWMQYFPNWKPGNVLLAIEAYTNLCLFMVFSRCHKVCKVQFSNDTLLALAKWILWFVEQTFLWHV